MTTTLIGFRRIGFRCRAVTHAAAHASRARRKQMYSRLCPDPIDYLP